MNSDKYSLTAFAATLVYDTVHSAPTSKVTMPALVRRLMHLVFGLPALTPIEDVEKACADFPSSTQPFHCVIPRYLPPCVPQTTVDPQLNAPPPPHTPFISRTAPSTPTPDGFEPTSDDTSISTLNSSTNTTPDTSLLVEDDPKNERAPEELPDFAEPSKLFSLPREIPATSADYGRFFPMGRGTFGAVDATLVNCKPCRIVAVKTCIPNDPGNTVQNESSAKRALQWCKHPNISRVVHIFYQRENDGKASFCAVSQLHLAGPLSDYIELLSAEDWRICAAKLWDALQTLHHEFGVVHRDIKPTNVMVSRDGQPLLIDFGLITTRKGGSTRPWSAGEGPLPDAPVFEGRGRVGTFGYMAPELFDPKHVHGKAVDYFSFGVMLFELFHHKLPWPGDIPKPLKFLRKGVIYYKYAPFLIPDVPEDPKDQDRKLFIERLLETNPTRRIKVGNRLPDWFEEPALDWHAIRAGTLMVPGLVARARARADEQIAEIKAQFNTYKLELDRKKAAAAAAAVSGFPRSALEAGRKPFVSADEAASAQDKVPAKRPREPQPADDMDI